MEELFPAGLLDDMFGAYQRLLHDLAADDSAWQRTLAENARRLIPAAQMALRDAANNTAAPLTGDLLHTPFLKQVAERPEQLAVCTPKRRLTYREVYRYACRIEQELLRCQVKPNELVAVMMEKGWEQIVAVLGIHFAGAAYLPIDPELPAERQRFLLEHAKVKVALTQSGVRNRLSVPASVEVFEVDQLKPADDSAPADRRRQKPEDLAYVIYTSGSTGVPKGVMIDHRGALNTVLDINQRFGVGPQDRILAVSRLSFDLSVYDVFGLLAAGGTIVMPAADLAYDANHWAELILAERVTLWDTVPALLQLLVDQAGKPELLGDSLRLVMMSGDWIPLGLPDQIRRVLPKVNVVSLGGATEASIWSILFPIGKVDPNWKSIPYGKAMLNQSFHVMNQDFAPCPTWVPGQLYIGGVGLAKGYLHDEQKTSASFVVNPANGERLYRTGDLGRFLPDGNIEFLGREDFQVKVQGYRIELGEIEARLQEYAGVDLCIVIVREDTPREKRLVGYVVAKPGATIDPDASERASSREAAGIHGSRGHCGPGPFSADAQRKSRSQGSAGAGALDGGTELYVGCVPGFARSAADQTLGKGSECPARWLAGQLLRSRREFAGRRAPLLGDEEIVWPQFPAVGPVSGAHGGKAGGHDSERRLVAAVDFARPDSAGRKQTAVLLRARRRRQRPHLPRTGAPSRRGLSILRPASPRP